MQDLMCLKLFLVQIPSPTLVARCRARLHLKKIPASRLHTILRLPELSYFAKRLPICTRPLQSWENGNFARVLVNAGFS
jgi:hypothetical protein